MKCFACSKKLGANPNIAICEDEQWVFVGSECFKQIVAQSRIEAVKGWQPPAGGPKLYAGKFSPNGTLLEVVGLVKHPLVGKILR